MATERVLVLVALLLVAAGAGYREIRRARVARAARDGVFAAALGALDDAWLDRGPHRYPVLHGRHRGDVVRAEVVVDTLTMRKLPVLWVSLAVHRSLPLDCPVDALARPLGTEFFSPNASFGHQLSTPPDFPVHVRIAAPRPARLPGDTYAALADLMRDTGVKEVYIGPKGGRIVYMLAEAAQTPYRTSRRADFGAPGLAPDTVTRLLDGLAGLADGLPARNAGALS